jgi:hypothetical protein
MSCRLRLLDKLSEATSFREIFPLDPKSAMACADCTCTTLSNLYLVEFFISIGVTVNCGATVCDGSQNKTAVPSSTKADAYWFLNAGR